MSNCEDCFPTMPLIAYRVVQTMAERNTIPCTERMNGLVVTVVEDNFKQYMLQGGDPCVNVNWVEYMSEDYIRRTVGHFTDTTTSPPVPITSAYLNSRFPESQEGFMVTFTALNTTFLRIAEDIWILIGNTKI